MPHRGPHVECDRYDPNALWLLAFDLDGTLIDSSTDLCQAINAALAHVGRSPLSKRVITSFIGDGAPLLVRRALHAEKFSNAVHRSNEDEALFEVAYSFFLDYYREHQLDHTHPYAGVVDALQLIRQRRPCLPMAILTNKPVRPSRAICDGLGLSPFFFANYGGDSFATKMPNPEGLSQIMAETLTLRAVEQPREMLFRPEHVVMVGDSEVDVFTARACGARCLGCSYGLQPESLAAAKPDWLVDRPRDWLTALGL